MQQLLVYQIISVPSLLYHTGAFSLDTYRRLKLWDILYVPAIFGVQRQTAIALPIGLHLWPQWQPNSLQPWLPS